MSDCADKYVCTKCRRALRFSLMRCIGCLLIGGHDYFNMRRESLDHYNGYTRYTDGCKRCGWTRYTRAYEV